MTWQAVADTDTAPVLSVVSPVRQLATAICDDANITHMGLTCQDYDTVAAEVASEVQQLRDRVVRLTELLDRTRNRVRTLEQDNALLSNQNEIMCDELSEALPYGTLFTVPVSGDTVRAAWRATHPGSRGPVPRAVMDVVAGDRQQFDIAISELVTQAVAAYKAPIAPGQ